MSNLSNINKKQPAQGTKHKHPIKSTCLQEKYDQKGQVDNLPTQLTRPD